VTEPNLPDLARDCVYTTLHQTSSVQTLDTVMEKHGLGPAEMMAVVTTPAFREKLRAEKARARELGFRAGHVIRVETILGDLIEMLYERLDGAEVSDIIKAVQVLSRMAGLDELPDRRSDRGVTMAVQINVPALQNPKLAHLKGGS
jgi:hypothetical protein